LKKEFVSEEKRRLNEGALLPSLSSEQSQQRRRRGPKEGKRELKGKCSQAERNIR